MLLNPLISLRSSFSYQRHVIYHCLTLTILLDMSESHPLYYDVLICRLLLTFSIVELIPEWEYNVGPGRHLYLNRVFWRFAKYVIGRGLPNAWRSTWACRNDNQNAETSLVPFIFIFQNGRSQPWLVLGVSDPLHTKRESRMLSCRSLLTCCSSHWVEAIMEYSFGLSGKRSFYLTRTDSTIRRCQVA